MPVPTWSERIEGGLVGLLVGDALGVPYEFKTADQLQACAAIDMQPAHDFDRSHPGVPPGTWSDDGAQALCLLESLMTCGKLDADDFARRLLDWYTRGHLAVDGHVFDIGIQTQAALARMLQGTPPLSAAARAESANGNGALMRVLPLALWSRGDDAELVRDARLSSAVTHGHLRSQLCCALYCLWIRRLLHGAPDAWNEALAALRHLTRDDAEAQLELAEHIRPELPPERPGSGYVVDTLRSARWLCEQADYEAVVLAAVRLGSDTDTTAAVAGGAAGVRWGVQGIPARWRDALRGRELLDPLRSRLLGS